MTAKYSLLRTILVTLLLFPLSPVDVAMALAPYITPFPDRTTPEDVPISGITFSVSDSESPPEELIVGASSSNTNLVLVTNISIHCTGYDEYNAYYTAAIKPEPEQHGTTTITFDVSDPVDGFSSESFILTVTPVDDSPNMYNFSDQTIEEGSVLGPVNFYIWDVDTPANGLVPAGTSSNPTLVPDANISFGGAGNSRSVTITPTPGETGSATITITVSDGNTSVSDQFTLLVKEYSDSPTISDIPNQIVVEDGTAGPINFTVGDPDDELDSLILSKTSSNQILVPEASIVLGGSGANRTVTVTPAGDQNGIATITIHVSDGVLTTSDTLTLNVAAVNDPPSFTKVGGDQSVDEDSGPHTVPGWATAIKVGPPNESTQTPTFELIPDDAALFSASGQPAIDLSGNLTFTPADNKNGSTKVTVRLRDDGGTANGGFPVSSFVVLFITVNPVNDPPADITLSSDKIAENQPVGSVVGSLSAADVDADEAFTFSLSSSPTCSGTDNSSFIIEGSTLKTAAVFDAETRASYSICVRVTDKAGAPREEPFIISILSINGAPLALDDPFDIRQGSTLIVDKTTGILANDMDTDELFNLKGYDYLTVGDILTFPQHAGLFKMTQDADGELRGGFVYRPEPDFVGVDTFSYLAVDKEGIFSLPAAVQITVLDFESPEVKWITPVTDGITLDVTTGKVTLAVEAVDNVSISRVRFLRWDASRNKQIVIGIDDESPYKVALDTYELNWGWNQILAEAYDNLDNRSNIPFIWLYKSKIPTFLPIIRVSDR